MKTDSGLAHDVFRRARHPLDPFFKPRSVAVIGATETPGSVGRTVLANLVATPFGGAVYPVNPRRDTVLGLKSYPAVGDVPGPVDLAVVVTPAATVPEIIRRVRRRGRPRARSIISAGFRETGPAGRGAGGARVRGGAPGRHAHHRPELPGRHEPDERPQRHLRRRHRPARAAWRS